MKDTLFHIYRNTPFGRETLMHSVLLCKRLKDIQMSVYIPQYTQFLMYFDSEVVTVDLNSSYTDYPDTAKERASAILDAEKVDYLFLEPKDVTAHTLPNLPVHFTYMTCPRSIIDSTNMIGLGYIGSRVRRIVKNAQFPVLVTPPTYKEWNSITAFYGGSRLGVNAVRTAFHLADRSGLPMRIFTQWEPSFSDTYESGLEEAGLLERIRDEKVPWSISRTGELEDNLFNVPYDTLMVLGAAGHGSMKKLLFGSKLERIQRTLPNPLLIIGPHCTHSMG